MMRRPPSFLAFTVLVAALPSGSARAQPAAPKADTTITVRAAGSALEFLPANFSLKQGIRVELRFTNDGSLPHNLVLAKAGTDLDVLSTEAYGAGATNYVPPEMKDQLIVASELISTGQTAVLTFVVPPPGEYTFLCLFPGHANMMVGTLRAQR